MHSLLDEAHVNCMDPGLSRKHSEFAARGRARARAFTCL